MFTKTWCFFLTLCLPFACAQATQAADDLAFQVAMERLSSPKHFSFLKFLNGMSDNDLSLMAEAYQDFPELVQTPIVPPGFDYAIHPFEFALRANSSNEVLLWLLDHGIVPNELLFDSGFTPITLAAAMGKGNISEMLEERLKPSVGTPLRGEKNP